MSDVTKTTAMLIPAYEPDDKLITYVKELAERGFENIIVVNDGSSEKCDAIFAQVEQIPQCRLISYHPNGGKGHALKEGLKYFMENCPDLTGIVTADADGQHTMPDAIACAELMEQHPDSLILGVRDFDGENIPARSSFGNKMTTVVFKLTHGVRISDTQTGLRAIPRAIVPRCIDVAGDRYEYEMNMLIECADNKIPIREVPIETIYIDDNASSHFRPVRDSVRIYSLILKSSLTYIASSLLCTLVDLIIFTVLLGILPESFAQKNILGIVTLNVLIAAVSARIVSSLMNFFINQRVVFKSSGDTGGAMVRYYILATGQILVSAVLVSNLLKLFGLTKGILATLIKCVVDVTLFFVLYHFQRSWVFKKKSDKE